MCMLFFFPMHMRLQRNMYKKQNAMQIQTKSDYLQSNKREVHNTYKLKYLLAFGCKTVY